MRLSKPLAEPHNHRVGLAAGLAFLSLWFAAQSSAFPIGGATFRDDAPFQNATNGLHLLTSNDGLLTVAAWADPDATLDAALYQWWWILGVDSGVGNLALLDGSESMSLQFADDVGASHIAFLHTGGIGGTGNSNLARISITGFLSDPQAYATTYLAPRISNLTYAGGTLTFDYLWDTGNDYGQLLFAKAAASAGQSLQITGAISAAGNATGWGAGLFRVDCQELYGGPALQPVSVRHNFTNRYTTPDGGLTVRAYANTNATVPANFGTYVDQCFGVFGGANSGAVDTNESVTLQFAAGVGMSRFETVYSQGNVSISGFLSDPGFTDLQTGSRNASYGNGILSFEPVNGGRHIFFFTNRAASAGQILRVTVETAPTNQLAIACVGYSDLQALLAPDVPSISSETYTTPDGLLTLTAYSDTPGTAPTLFYENVDWFGILGGNNEAIDGTESMQMQFAPGTGLKSFGTRYTSGQVVLSGFSADPGFTDPSGMATGVSYAAGTLSYTFNTPHAPEHVVTFTNVAASVGQTLSLHTDGNPGSQIALTRINYGAPLTPVTLLITRYGNNVVLSWPSGTLQQSSTVNGNYSDVTGAPSPYTNSIVGPQKFFRVKVQ